MGRIILGWGRVRKLGIRFNNRRTEWSRVTVTKGMSEETLRKKINRAKGHVIWNLQSKAANAKEAAERAKTDRLKTLYKKREKTYRDMIKEARALSTSSAASSIYQRLSRKPAARRAPPARPAPRPARRRRRRRVRRRRRTTRRRRRQAPTTPKITASWIEALLRDAASGRDAKARGAATKAHSSRLFVDRFLSPVAQRGVKRTANQKAATVAIFKKLYSSCSLFGLLLSGLAGQQVAMAKKSFPEFIDLQLFISKQNRANKGDLANKGLPIHIRGADMYIRYFLFNYAANESKYSRYRAEIIQLPEAKRRLANIKAGKDLKLQLSGTMDSGTLTASLLFLRRWTLEHPKRGRGKSQARISLWKAPSVVPLPRRAAVVPRPVRRISVGVPVVGAIGDSITAAGRYSRTLRRILGRKFRGARVSSYGVSGQNIEQIAARFNKDIIRNRKRFNTVIIQGGVNNIAGMSFTRIRMSFVRMIRAARAKRMKVIVIGITPWAGCATSNRRAQALTQQLNYWLKTYLPRRFRGVVFVDPSPLGEPVSRGSSVLKLKKQYDKGDGLHLNNDGQDRLAQLIAQAAYKITPKPVGVKAMLRRWAAKHWKNLKDRIFVAVKDGKAADVLKISKNIPSGRKSLKRALDTIKRDDLYRAYDRVFNELLRTDKRFVKYCLGRYRLGRFVRRRRGRRRKYTQYELNKRKPPADRRLIAMAIKAYINHMAAQRTDLGTRLKGDLRKLLITNLKLRSSTLPRGSPTEDMKTLAAVAVYRWRIANPQAEIGAWDKPSRTTPAPRPIRRTVPRKRTPAPRPRDTGKRRKTITI